MNNKVKLLLTGVAFCVFTGAPAFAEYYCEVMTLQGKAAVMSQGEDSDRELKVGDLIKEGDQIRVAEGSVDLAFDKDWNNVTRLAQNTEVTVRSIYPTGLVMDRGDIFARLEKLPKNSTFEIQTPTCVAAVRGSAYRTIHEDGESRVLNYASSPVEVFGLDKEGKLLDNPVILHGEEKTDVADAGKAPREPEKMTEAEIKEADEFREEVKNEVEKLEGEGRVGQVQDIASVDSDYKNDLEKRIQENQVDSTIEKSDETQPADKPLSQIESAEPIEDRMEKVVSATVASTETQTAVSTDRKQDQTANTSTGGGGTMGDGSGGGNKLNNVK